MQHTSISYLPFTDAAKAWLAENGPDPVALCSEPEFERARACGLERVLSAVASAEWQESGYKDEDRIRGYYYARMLVSAVKDKWLVGRFALSEAVYMRAYLMSQPLGIPMAADALGLPVEKETGDYDWSMHFTDYLVVATAINDAHWKLATQPMKGGRVYMTDKRATRVLQEAFRERTTRELPRDVTDLLPLLAESAEKVKEALKVARPDEGPAVAAVSENYPPCVNAVMTMLDEGRNAPHTARFLLAAFLNGAGTPSEEIAACFRNAPDYDAEVTRMQIESIKSKGERGYTPPMCSVLRSQGLCHADSFCRSTKGDGTPRVTNPMHYYRAKSWRPNK